MSEAHVLVSLAGSVESGMYQSGDLWGAALRLLVAMAIVVPLAYFAARLFSRRAAGAGGRVLKVLEAVPLGPNRGIYLVEAGDRILVLGMTPEQVNLLTEWSDPDCVERIKREAIGGKDPAFSHALGDAIARFRKAKREDDSE